MTKELEFQNPQKYVLLKTKTSKLYIKLSPFRSSPPEVLSIDIYAKGAKQLLSKD